MSFDYSSLLNAENNEYLFSWKDVYNRDLPLPENFFSLLKRSVYLPLDHYRIITAYAFIPSVLARVVPYLFLWGISGSGKSTIGKLVSYLHGIDITSSSDTFAAIRNSLSERRKTTIIIPSKNPDMPIGDMKEVETNTMMVWDDIDPSIFATKSDIYRLFKFGYDKSSDVIKISSEVAGHNLSFRCFCPKVFSSISPLHLDEQFKELRRRLIVIPTKRIEDLAQPRKQELGIFGDSWEREILDISNLSWRGFSNEFKEYWNLERAKLFLVNRQKVTKETRGLSSQQRAISIDLITTGITIGIWHDLDDAVTDMKNYWQWFKGEVKIGESPLAQLLKKIIKQEEKNALAGNTKIAIYHQMIKANIDDWVAKGYLLDKPNSKTISLAMNELGYRMILGGKWVKS